MKKWYVITPEYGVLIPITDEGQGPMEYGCDVIEIEAETKRDAIVLGVREMLKGGDGGHGRGMRYEWCLTQRDDGCSPFTGVRAELAPEMCTACNGDGCSACNDTGCVPTEPLAAAQSG